MRTVLSALLLAVLFLPAGCAKKESAQQVPTAAPVTATPGAAGTVPAAANIIYVPAYSHVVHGRGDERTLLAITLSVRNLGPYADLSLEYVDYYDTPGRMVRRYLDSPRVLGPLETAEFIVTARDDAGGSGANFLVGWSGSSNKSDLMAESVMVGHTGDGYLSFTSRGIALRGTPSARLHTTPAEAEPMPSPETSSPADGGSDR